MGSVKLNGLVTNVGIHVEVAAGKADRILADKPLEARVVVPRPVVVESGAVVFQRV